MKLSELKEIGENATQEMTTKSRDVKEEGE